MYRILTFAILLSVSMFALPGCGGEPAADDPADASEEPAEPVEAPGLSETITLPAGWEINDAITAAEVEAIMGRTGYESWYETLSDPAAGKPQGSFYDGQLAASCVNFLVYCSEGQSNYDRVTAFINEPVEAANELWDQAIVGTMEDAGATKAAILIRRGDVCIRIRYDVAIYPELDRTATLTSLAELLINRIYAL